MGRFSRLIHHPLSPFRKRTLASIMILVGVMLIGVEGMVLLEGWNYVDAFYFMSLIATTQGPTRNPETDGGKIFASAMAFVAVGAVISSIAFVFGPLFGTLFKEGADYLEKEERKFRKKALPEPTHPKIPDEEDQG